MLTILGTVLGVGSLVATIGIAQTAGGQIVGEFDSLAATSVSVEPRDSAVGATARGGLSLPWDAEMRLNRLNGVVAAGSLTLLEGSQRATARPALAGISADAGSIVDLYAASPGLFEAIDAALTTGRFFDAGHSERRDRVAVLGGGVAERLGISRVEQLPTVRVGQLPLTVVGVMGSVGNELDLLQGIVIPVGTARETFSLIAPDRIVIRTEIGAARLIAEQSVVALSPSDPSRLVASIPVEPTAVRSAVESNVNTLALALGAVTLLVGALGIANVTLVSVVERVGEIGLRRAVGATRMHVAVLFLLESAVMGLSGGVIGTSLGILTIVLVGVLQNWTPLMSPSLPVLGPLVGGCVGLLAGLYPSWRASRVEPITALRAGV